MTHLTHLFSAFAFAAVACFTGTAATHAGLFGCGCAHGPARHAPVVYAGPAMHTTEPMDACCECASVVPGCCGIGGVGGGLVQLGNLYGSSGHFGGGYSGHPDPRSFESGFENLPNMDGGGVHHRLPFHSYRRPWAHPGVADNNINIVW
ncbi:MAG: hypothetical protein KDB01_03270 [Planctomycetaceae bacterium]|nr:hypothetical protein [Planctomycetaceae bacterium]